MSYSKILEPANSGWIYASAGSGKTTTIIRRIINLLQQSYGRILCLTFSKSACQELQSRLEQALQQAGLSILANYKDRVHICTINAFCHQLLQQPDFQGLAFPYQQESKQRSFSCKNQS